MKKSLFGITLTLLLTGMISCDEETPDIPDYNNTRTSLQTDTINSPGIVFDFGDTSMDEDIEDIVYHSDEWEDSPMDVDL